MNREKLESLTELSDLLNKKIITSQEYEVQKALILKPAGCLGGIALASQILTPQVVALLLAAAFYFPLLSTLSKTSELGFGDFAVKIEQATRIFGDEELVKTLKSLSREEIITLLDSGKGYYSLVSIDETNKEISLDSRYEYYVRLDEKGLIKANENLQEFRNTFSSKTPIRRISYNDLALGDLDTELYPSAAFSSEELKRAKNLSARLSARGLKIHTLIVDLTSKEISTLE